MALLYGRQPVADIFVVLNSSVHAHGSWCYVFWDTTVLHLVGVVKRAYIFSMLCPSPIHYPFRKYPGYIATTASRNCWGFAFDAYSLSSFCCLIEEYKFCMLCGHYFSCIYYRQLGCGCILYLLVTHCQDEMLLETVEFIYHF